MDIIVPVLQDTATCWDVADEDMMCPCGIPRSNCTDANEDGGGNVPSLGASRIIPDEDALLARGVPSHKGVDTPESACISCLTHWPTASISWSKVMGGKAAAWSVTDTEEDDVVAARVPVPGVGAGALALVDRLVQAPTLVALRGRPASRRCGGSSSPWHFWVGQAEVDKASSYLTPGRINCLTMELTDFH